MSKPTWEKAKLSPKLSAATAAPMLVLTMLGPMLTTSFPHSMCMRWCVPHSAANVACRRRSQGHASGFCIERAPQRCKCGLQA